MYSNAGIHGIFDRHEVSRVEVRVDRACHPQAGSSRTSATSPLRALTKLDPLVRVKICMATRLLVNERLVLHLLRHISPNHSLLIPIWFAHSLLSIPFRGLLHQCFDVVFATPAVEELSESEMAFQWQRWRYMFCSRTARVSLLLGKRSSSLPGCGGFRPMAKCRMFRAVRFRDGRMKGVDDLRRRGLDG